MRAVILLVIACGGKPAAKPPQPSPAETLAKQLDDDMATLAELAHRNAADCVALAKELRPHVDRMNAHAADVAAMMQDHGNELKAALARYNEVSRTDAIAKDLGAAYVGCKDADAKYGIERSIADIPTY